MIQAGEPLKAEAAAVRKMGSLREVETSPAKNL